MILNIDGQEIILHIPEGTRLTDIVLHAKAVDMETGQTGPIYGRTKHTDDITEAGLLAIAKDSAYWLGGSSGPFECQDPEHDHSEDDAILGLDDEDDED